MDDLDARILKGLCGVGEEFAAGFDDHLVRLDHVDFLDFRVVRIFARNTAIAAADNEHPAHIRMHRHGHMRDHFVINELVGIRKDDVPIQRQQPAIFRRLENFDALVFAVGGKELPGNPQAHLAVGRMNPHVHLTLTP